MPDASRDEHLRAALAQVEEQRDDAVAYLSAIKRVLDAVAAGGGPRECGQRIAEALIGALMVESCAVALAEQEGEQALAGFATQGHRLGGPRGRDGQAGWLALARLVRRDAGPTFFRRLADGSFEAITSATAGGEGFAVLPLRLGGEAGGALVLHTLTNPAQVFARGRALELLADIVGDALTIAHLRGAGERLCRELEAELGLTRRALTDQRETLRSQGENIRELTQALIRSNRVKRDFLGTVSHELRTPLNAILGYTALVRDGVAGSLSDEQAGLLDRVLVNTQGLNGLIDDMLFFVELEADRTPVRRDRVAVRELIGQVVTVLPESKGQARVPLHVEVVPEARTLRVDPALLRRMLLHLLSNAFKFTTEGVVTVTVEPDELPGAAVVVVRDTGIGIPADRLQEVFELFAQADGSTTRRFAGMGMGLTIVQRCARLLGGELTVASEPGQGSEFRVRIPGVLASGEDDVPRAAARVMH